MTGLGLLTPIGNNVADTWDNIKNGISGIRLIDSFDVSDFAVRIGGLIKNFCSEDYISNKEARKLGTFVIYGIAAGAQAIKDSGIEITRENAHKTGVSIGSGVGGVAEIENSTKIFLERGASRISPFYVPGNIINMIPGYLSIKYGLTGPNLSIVTACTTGTHNIGNAARLIEYGDADIMIAGGAEAVITPTVLAGFISARALSRRNDDPQAASRPWDKNRDGFVMSDGAGAVVLEEYEYARQRGARIYGELIGYGVSADAYHMTSPSKNGHSAADSMHNALHNAKLDPRDIDYINAHGTSTLVGDAVEVTAIKRVFGDYAKKLPISSSKSMIGHLLGASGAVEAIISILALRDRIIPPTINLDEPDSEYDLDFVPHEARQVNNIQTVLSNSFGFGGTNGTLIFKQI